MDYTILMCERVCRFLACGADSNVLLQSGDQGQYHIPGMPYGSPAYPAYWQQPPAQGLIRAAPPNVASAAYMPQHLSQRSQSQPHLGPPPGRYGAYQARPPQQPPAFSLHLQPQQEQQALEAQAQAQLHQALENQTRLAVDQQLQPQQQQAAGQAQQPGEALRDRVLGQQPAGGAFRPARWPGAGINDQLNAAQASEQTRRLAELLASNRLQHNEPGLLRQMSGHQQQPGLPSQQLGQGSDPPPQDQSHRLASWGAVSAPDQMYQLNSLGGNVEQAYRLQSLGATSSPGAAFSAFHEGANQGRQYPGSQAAPDSLSDNLTYFGNQYGQHSHSTPPALRDWSQGL